MTPNEATAKRRSVMARKSVLVRLTPRQAFALLRVTHSAFSDDAARVFSARSAIRSALYDDGWMDDEHGTWTKAL